MLSKQNKKQFTDFWSKSHCVSDTPDLKGTALRWWMELFWGPMIYTEEPTYNFINVYKKGNKYWLSDAILVNQLPHLKPCGTLIPRKLKDKLPKNETGPTNNPILQQLHDVGFIIQCVPLTDDERQLIIEAPYSQNVNDAYYSSDAIQAKASHNDFLGGTAWDKAEPISKKILDSVDISGNALLESGILYSRTLRLGRSTKSTAIDPHTECDQSVFLGVVHYLFEGKEPIRGRQFTIYHQDPWDEFMRVHGLMTEEFHLYTHVDWSLKPAVEFTPIDSHAVFCNFYNPRFPHGVQPQLSDEYVYSLTAQLSNEDVPDYNGLNAAKKLGNRYHVGKWGESLDTDNSGLKDEEDDRELYYDKDS